jgi:hypothetical protein
MRYGIPSKHDWLADSCVRKRHLSVPKRTGYLWQQPEWEEEGKLFARAFLICQRESPLGKPAASFETDAGCGTRIAHGRSTLAAFRLQRRGV